MRVRSTILKQLIYGIFYLVIAVGVGYGSFLLFRSTATCSDNRQNQREEGVDCGGPCIACAIKALQPFTISPITLVHGDENTLSLFFNLSNPNASYGAEKFFYTVTLIGDAGAPVHTFTGSSYLYPSEIRTVADVGLVFPNAEEVIRADVVVSDVLWREAALFTQPRLETRAVSLQRDPITNELQIRGLLSNKNSFELARAGVGAVVRIAGIPLAVSKTVVTDLAAFEERSFFILVPNLEDTLVALSDVTLFTEGVR